MSPTTAQQTMSYAPPLLRLSGMANSYFQYFRSISTLTSHIISASPHDAHLLATFSQDSNLIRILDVRQPGQALLELRGHAASINCIEWSPTRRGMLASGADDSMVLVWDLLNQSNPSIGVTAGANGSQPGQPAAGAVTTPGSGTDIGRGPTASWRCDYEVANLSWAPQSPLTSHGGDWLGVTGGRGLWGVKL
jgi:WD repeat-containing protein 68